MLAALNLLEYCLSHVFWKRKLLDWPMSSRSAITLSLSLNFSFEFLLACSAVPLCCLWRRTQRHDLVSVQYFISFGILCIFKYRFSFYRIKYFCFKGLLKHISLFSCLRLSSWSAQGCRSELTSGSFRYQLEEEMVWDVLTKEMTGIGVSVKCWFQLLLENSQFWLSE